MNLFLVVSKLRKVVRRAPMSRAAGRMRWQILAYRVSSGANSRLVAATRLARA
jgi:hypothetical protein